MPTWLLVLVILAWAAVQYGLAFWALRDLWRRPRVRGDNKTTWVIVILTLPIVGALVYATYGPTSFLPRPPGRPRLPAPGGRPPGRPATTGTDVPP